MNDKNFLEENQLAKYLEQIIFRKDELKELAKNITQLKKGEISLDEYKTKLLETRVRILNDITEFSIFYIKTKLNSDTIEKQNESELQKELKEKTILLEEIAKRLQKVNGK